MDSIQMDSQSSREFNNFIGRNYETALNQSLQSLLESFQDWNSEKLSNLTSTFGELLQCKVNPPLETIWVYSALVFQKRNSLKNASLNQFPAVKDLFQLIVSYSASCDSLISILMMSPVIYHVHKFAVDLKGFELRSKKEKKLMKEIRELVNLVIGYVNLSSDGLVNSADSSEGLFRPLKDLISIWMWDKKDEKGSEDRLKLFFPLLGDEIVEKIMGGSCGLSELAGYVIAQVFLLKCCLAFGGENSAKDLQNELRNEVVGSITGLCNAYFFDVLLRLLLGPSLPVTSLLSSGDEIRLRKVLYDAVTLVDYSCLSPERMVHLHVKHVKSIVLGKLIVTHEAVEFFRKQGEQSKALSCLNAFSGSSLPSQLRRCVKTEIGIKGNANEPNESTPKALLRWILNIENRGMQVFDDDMAAYRAKVVFDLSEEDSKRWAYEENKKSDSDIFFYIDNEGEDKDDKDTDETMTETVSASFVAAAHSLQLSEHGGKKRKSKKDGKKTQIKFLKYDLYEDSAPPGDKSTFIDTNDVNSASDVENPTSDDED